VARYNKLLSVVATSLQDMEKALTGEITMSSEFDEMLYCLHNNQIPKIWKRASYPNIMRLGDWLKDFSKRMSFFKKWTEEEGNILPVFWMSGFSFAQGLLTAVLQR
jgi:dynein heavy chain, axonemal